MIWVKILALNKLTNYSFEIRFVKITTILREKCTSRYEIKKKLRHEKKKKIINKNLKNDNERKIYYIIHYYDFFLKFYSEMTSNYFKCFKNVNTFQ